MKHIIQLSFGSSRHSSSEIIDFEGNEIRMTFLGADFDFELYKSILKSYDGRCDAFAISFTPAPVHLRRKTLIHEIIKITEASVVETPVFFGHMLRSIYMSWAVQRAVEQGRFRCDTSNVLFLNGLHYLDLARMMEPMALSTKFLDPWMQMRIPKVLTGVKQLEKYTQLSAQLLVSAPIKTPKSEGILRRFVSTWSKKALMEADLIVAPTRYVEYLDPKILQGKTLLLDGLTPEQEIKMRAARVGNVFYSAVQLKGLDKSYPYSVTEALIAISRDTPDRLTQEDILDYFSSEGIEAELKELIPSQSEMPRKFAFIIHPLSRRDLFRHPLLKPIMSLPNAVGKKFEHHIARAPGILYGNIKGIRSEHNGVRTEGLIYSLFATPREMLEAKPEDVYQKLIALSEDAHRRGVKIIGLGAFTKIVGDAGVTVASRSPIPVTTGNSLSAAATLWAAKEACLKMGFIEPKQSKDDKVDATVMVIGATGSIGKACVKVLGESFKNLIIAATNGPRLMALQKELKEMYPDCSIRITTQPERYSALCELIVVSTSATEGGAFSIDNVKPGCVVCDVSRPLTFSSSDAMKRPDVLIIESGEIELPGDVKISCDIGLEKSVVYACLAETALLALEGRYESFTLSRNVNYKKVREIYRMAKKHGARLAEIRSPNGVITDQEIELCREHALRSLKEFKKHG